MSAAQISKGSIYSTGAESQMKAKTQRTASTFNKSKSQMTRLGMDASERLRSIISQPRFRKVSRTRVKSQDFFLELHGKLDSPPESKTFLFSAAIRKAPAYDTRALPPGIASDVEFSYKFEGPEMQSMALSDLSQTPGHIPLSTAFHMQSHRERTDDDDDGLEVSGLTAAEEIAGKHSADYKSVSEDSDFEKHLSILYDSITMTKGDYTFPYRTFKPKVQVPYKVAHGLTPQAVVMERLHRMYRKTDINVVLQNLEVTYMDLLPLPYHDEGTEKFLQEMQWKQRTHIMGVNKLDFLEKFRRQGDEDEEIEKNKKDFNRVPNDLEIASGLEIREQTKLGQNTRENSSSSKAPSTFHKKSGGKTVDDLPTSRMGSVTEAFADIVKSNFGPTFPLVMFDNTEYDIRSGEEWVKLGWDKKESKFYPLPAKAFLPMPRNPKRTQTKQASAPYGEPENDNRITRNYSRTSLPEVTYQNILNLTSRLRKFRHWLLHEKYDRMAVSVAEQDEEPMVRKGGRVTLAMPDKTDFFKNPYGLPLGPVMIPSVQSVSRPANAKTSKYSLSYSQSALTTVPISVQSLYAGEMGGEIGDDYSSSLFDLQNVNMNFFQQFKTFQTIGVGSTESKDETQLQKSKSLLSDTFSEPLSLAVSPQVSENIHDKRKVSKDGNTNGVAEVDSSDGISISASDDDENEEDTEMIVDIDPYEEGYDKVIFEYDKMKKITIHDWKWVDVAVFLYDPEAKRYLVRAINPPYVCAWVSKIYLFMDGEDPYNHAARIKDAILRRQEVENVLRYNLYIDCLSIDDTARIASSHMKNILVKILSTPKLKIEDDLLKRIQREIDLGYRRTQAELEFNYIVSQSPSLYQPWVEIPEALHCWKNSQNWKKQQEYRLVSGNFSYKKTKIQKLSVIFKEEPFDCLVDVMGACIDIQKRHLLLTRTGIPLRLLEYLKMQDDNIKTLSTALRQDWMDAVLATVKHNLSKIPQSWYNIAENRWDVFLMSKTSNFLRVVRYMMENAVRQLTEQSLHNFVEEMEQLTVNCQVDYSYDWGDDLRVSEFTPPGELTPVFRLDLVLEQEGPKYSELLDLFPKVAASLFDGVLQSTRQLPDIIPLIMTNLLFGTNRHLNVLDDNEAHIKQMKVALIRCIRRALIPVDKYAQKYRRYLPLWTLNLQDYLKVVERRNPAATEMKKIVEEHTAEYDKLEAEIPESLDINCFRISTDTVKQNILKKKKSIINGLLDQYSSKLQTAIRKIRDEYTEMEKKLITRSDDIEEVMKLKEFVEIVPPKVLHCSEMLGKFMKDYDVFEKFHYNISAEDFDMKWTTALMSSRLVKLAEKAVEWLNEDYDRLLKVQQQDMAALSDAVDSAFLSVAGLGAFLELEKATEVAAEVKKLWKQVNELKEQNDLLNRRQHIFGLPAHQNEALHRLIDDIEPFKHLWFTAADWERIREIVFKETLDKVDVNAVKKLISEGSVTMKRCVRFFKGADSIQHIAEEVLHEIEEFKTIVPLISTLKNQGMRQRHWEALSDICGFTIVAKGNQNFKALLDLGIQKYVDEIAAVGELASNEFAIETKMEAMLKELGKVKVETVYDQIAGINILNLIPANAMEIMRRCILDTTELQKNEFKAPFEEKLNGWEKKLNNAKDNIDLWLLNQHEWINIIPFFKAPDSAVSMPLEYKMFTKMERIWRRLSRLARDNPEILEVGSDSTVRASLLQFSSLVFKIKKGLDEHLRPRVSSSEDDDPETKTTETKDKSNKSV